MKATNGCLATRRKNFSKGWNSNLTLKDLTGFNGRCDAIYFTTEKEQLPPNETVQLANFRKKVLWIFSRASAITSQVLLGSAGISTAFTEIVSYG